MKRSGLLALSMVSLVALVGCGNNGGQKDKYAFEKKLVTDTVRSFFGADSLSYVRSGEQGILDGWDDDDNPIYVPGAQFSVIFWDSEDSEGNVSSCAPEEFLYTIGYQEDESGNKSAPLISQIVEDNELYNVTKQMYSKAPASYFKKEGGQDYLYCNLAEGFEGKQMAGVYCTADEDGYIEYVLSVEFLCVRVARDDIARYFGDEAATVIGQSGHFDGEDKIYICDADIKCENYAA